MESIDLVTHVVSLGPGLGPQRRRAAAAGSHGAAAAGDVQTSGWTRARACIVPNPIPGPNGADAGPA